MMAKFDLIWLFDWGLRQALGLQGHSALLKIKVKKLGQKDGRKGKRMEIKEYE